MSSKRVAEGSADFGHPLKRAKRERNDDDSNDYIHVHHFENVELESPPDSGEEGDGSSRSDLVSHIFHEQDFAWLHLKPDHALRPIWINPEDGQIILEAFSPIVKHAEDFLVAIAEPVSRQALIHEYKLTPYSLYAGASAGLQTEDIIEVLNRLSKVAIPDTIVTFIREKTMSYGKVKLVLKHNRYYVESNHPETLQFLLKDSIIRDARVYSAPVDDSIRAATFATYNSPVKGNILVPGSKDAKSKNEELANRKATSGKTDAKLFTSVVGLEHDEVEEDDDNVLAFEIDSTKINDVKKRCNELEYPMLEEYDFRNDTVNANLEIDLGPSTVIRPHQEISLSKMFGNGRARSGIIVLPCGAGKTLVGIAAACTIKKSCLVLCTSSVSAKQWCEQFKRWSNITDRQIAVFTADRKERFAGESGIVVSTYSMVGNTGNRAHESKKMMEFITTREWGLVLLDEVHVVPAHMFRQAVATIKAHSKLGLTATLVREDDKIEDLNYMIGPKLYEANWMKLAAEGHIANVQCAEVWCPTTAEFYREYLRGQSQTRSLLACMNPNKFQACQFLITYHEERGHRIIVFSDNVFALEAYAKKLGKPYIHGGTAQRDREELLKRFQDDSDPTANTIFLSKVGDTSIDLPEATCLIQISSHFGSRRQEAQRLGRILRAKRRHEKGFNAFFYTLVSKDTQEMSYSTKRQQFLVDQGYAFKVVTHLDGLESLDSLVYKSRKEQVELLSSVLLANESEAEQGTHVTRAVSEYDLRDKDAVPSKDFGAPWRTPHESYVHEQNTGKSANKRLARETPARHKLFAKRDKDLAAARKEGRAGMEG